MTGDADLYADDDLDADDDLIVSVSEVSVCAELSPVGAPAAVVALGSPRMAGVTPWPAAWGSTRLPTGSASAATPAADAPTDDDEIELDPDLDAEPAPPAAEPTRVSRLLVGDELARGGMAVIRRAFDPVIHREVALKSPHVAHAPESSLPDPARLLVEEAQITGQLEHPGIVPVHNLRRDGSMFAMALVQGHTYRTLLVASHQQGHPPHLLRWALEVFLKICDAVAFAHGCGVIHRDLKPDNIMIGRHGQVYVLDWGCALLYEPSPPARGAPRRPRVTISPASGYRSSAGVLFGSPAFMPPEQALGQVERVDPRADVYSLGAMLYFLLTGQGPHTADTFVEAVQRAQAGVVRPPDEVSPGGAMPAGLVAIAMKALAREPADRYPDVAALRAAVDKFVAGVGTFPQRRFAAGHVIVREGDPGDAAYLIERGVCEASRLLDGRPQVMRQMGVGEVFGEAAIVMDQPRSATVTAVTDVVVVEVGRSALESGLGMHAWLGNLVRSLAVRFRDAERQLGLTRDRHRDGVANAARAFLRSSAPVVGQARRTPWPPLRDALAAALGLEPDQVTDAVRRCPDLALSRDEATLSSQP